MASATRATSLLRLRALRLGADHHAANEIAKASADAEVEAVNRLRPERGLPGHRDRVDPGLAVLVEQGARDAEKRNTRAAVVAAGVVERERPGRNSIHRQDVVLRGRTVSNRDVVPGRAIVGNALDGAVLEKDYREIGLDCRVALREWNDGEIEGHGLGRIERHWSDRLTPLESGAGDVRQPAPIADGHERARDEPSDRPVRLTGEGRGNQQYGEKDRDRDETQPHGSPPRLLAGTEPGRFADPLVRQVTAGVNPIPRDEGRSLLCADRAPALAAAFRSRSAGAQRRAPPAWMARAVFSARSAFWARPMVAGWLKKRSFSIENRMRAFCAPGSSSSRAARWSSSE